MHDELCAKLCDRLKHEIQDAECYHHLSETYSVPSLRLSEMALDEMMHAKCIHDFLVCQEYPIPSDLESTYQKHVERHKSFGVK